jgi:hypothetical protein
VKWLANTLSKPSPGNIVKQLPGIVRGEMNRPADVDRMASSFLTELDTLSNSLGLMPDGAADGHSVNAQVQAPGSNGIASEEAETAPNPDRESPSPAISCGVPRRNIDILLMTDNRYIEGAKRNPEEFFRVARDLQDVCVSASPLHGQTRPAGPALCRLRCSLSWPPIIAWIRKLRRRGSSQPADS